MQGDETRHKLEALRQRVLNDISGMADQLANGDDVDYDSLITLARTTGRMEFLDKALERAQSIENRDEKMQSLLDLLDAVDVQLGLMRYDDKSTEGEGGTTQSSSESEAATDSDAHSDQSEQQTSENN